MLLNLEAPVPQQTKRKFVNLSVLKNFIKFQNFQKILKFLNWKKINLKFQISKFQIFFKGLCYVWTCLDYIDLDQYNPNRSIYNIILRI